MKSKTTRHGLKRMTALLLALVLCMGICFIRPMLTSAAKTSANSMKQLVNGS